MTERSTRTLAYSLGAATPVAVIAGTAMGAQHLPGSNLALPFFALISVAYGVSGAFLAGRRPANVIGWLMIGIGFVEALNVLSAGYQWFATNRPLPLPSAVLAAWIEGWVWLPGLGVIMTFLLLVFPDGRLLSRRWRWVAWVAGIGIALGTIGTAIGVWPFRFVLERDPFSDVTPGGIGGTIAALGTVMFVAASVGSMVSVAIRWRRATGDERQQLRWFLTAAAVLLAGFALAATNIDRGYVLLSLGMILLPISIAVAVMKYRLYDLDIVIKKTLIALVLALLLAGAGLFVVVTAGQVALWRGTPKAISVLVGIVIGVLFVPLLRLARRIANRLVYGRRATPYEVLSTFSSHVSETYSIDDVLPRLAQVLAAGTGASSARVLLRIGPELREMAAVGTVTDPEHVAAVVHQGDDLGALAVSFPANDPINTERERLIDDLAAQAGPVLRNVRLIEELKASRQRLVAAQDEERRRLERNIHDGAQQQLVALSVKLRLLEQVAARDGGKATSAPPSFRGTRPTPSRTSATSPGGSTPRCWRTRAWRQPWTRKRGRSRSRRPCSPMVSGGSARTSRRPCTSVASRPSRTWRSTRRRRPFTCACPRPTAICASRSPTTGVASTHRRPDTESGLQGIADRLAALGGSLEVRSAPGDGTTVAGRLPVGDAP